MTSAVEPGCAFRMRLTTVPADPYPAGAVVSRAPKIWMLGHARFSRGAAMVDPMRMKGIAAIADFMMSERIDIR
jgi:hypothetical protein